MKPKINTDKLVKQAGEVYVKDLELFNMMLGKLIGAANRKDELNIIFTEECSKKGIVYNGNSWFSLDNKNDNNIKTSVINITNNTLSRYYDGLLKNIENKIDKEFNSIEFNGKDFNKVITVTDKLIYDLKSAKKWAIEAEKIMKKARADYEKQKKNKQQMQGDLYLLTIDQLVEIATKILGRSTELCPIDTGFLRSSGTIFVFRNYVRIIYECPYAYYVHENLSNNHIIGQAKFLEAAAQEILPDRSIWVEIGDNTVYGDYYNDAWLKAHSDIKIDKTVYGTIYLDIDRNLKVNYHH